MAGQPPSAPDQVWVTDATCVLTGQGWLYVIALLDVFSRRIVGWTMVASLDAAAAVRSVEMAIAQRRPARGLVVHSDRGSQFASAAYRQTLAASERLLSHQSSRAALYRFRLMGNPISPELTLGTRELLRTGNAS